MRTEQSNDKKVSDVISDKIKATWLNKILLCKTTDGKNFSAKLVAFKDGQLFFETSKGEIIVDRLEMISEASVFRNGVV